MIALLSFLAILSVAPGPRIPADDPHAADLRAALKAVPSCFLGISQRVSISSYSAGEALAAGEYDGETLGRCLRYRDGHIEIHVYPDCRDWAGYPETVAHEWGHVLWYAALTAGERSQWGRIWSVEKELGLVCGTYDGTWNANEGFAEACRQSWCGQAARLTELDRLFLSRLRRRLERASR